MHYEVLNGREGANTNIKQNKQVVLPTSIPVIGIFFPTIIHTKEDMKAACKYCKNTSTAHHTFKCKCVAPLAPLPEQVSHLPPTNLGPLDQQVSLNVAKHGILCLLQCIKTKLLAHRFQMSVP